MRRLEYFYITIFTTEHSALFFCRTPWKFGMWITQIDCEASSMIQAPSGCTQYYLGSDGVLKTFNFEGVQYLAKQNYRICIRSERGACHLKLDSDPNQFSLQVGWFAPHHLELIY